MPDRCPHPSLTPPTAPQGSGILPEDFKGVGGPQGRTVGGPYVGGRFFDPMGLCRGSDEQTLKYKWNEVRGGGRRRAREAWVGGC